MQTPQGWGTLTCGGAFKVKRVGHPATTTYGYDNRNRLTSKQTPFGTLSYTYDSAGDLLTLASSNTNGASLTYAYDALNRLSTVTDNRLLAQGASSGVTTYNYDAVGNLQNFTYPNGVVHAYTYDALNRLTQMGSSKNSSSAISNYAYTLGAAGNRTSVAELSGRTVSYAYDSLYRLTSETVTAGANSKNGAVSYTYDNVGNRKTLNSTLPPSGAMNYTYDADDRLAADQYDADGNTIGSNGITNTYDFENHLITHGGVTVVYDGDGNRVSETVGGVTTNYLVDAQNPTGYAQVVDELQSSLVTRTYGYGLERIDEDQKLNGTWAASFYGYDGHGSVRQLTNSADAVTDTYDYDAFGNLINSTGSTPNVYLFAGEAYDGALGLYYNRARYYSSPTGRFFSMDTYQGDQDSPGSLHKYLYAEGNPVDNLDSSGKQIEEVMAAIMIGLIVATTACTQAGPQLVNVVKWNYYQQPDGVDIYLGAQTKGRTPHYEQFQWVQWITTNALLPKEKKFAQPDVPFIDPQPHDDKTDYYYTAQELQDPERKAMGFDLTFEDEPRRHPKQHPDVNGTIRWHADLYLVGIESVADYSSYFPITHITYGFTVDQNENMTWEPILIQRLPY